VIPDDVVERVRASADIVQIIGEHVKLRRMGADWRGPCPFHQGTNRNFSVAPRKQMYYCFVCHEGGDVFSFLQKRLGVDWPSAVRMVAAKSGIAVQEVDSRREGPDPREPLWEVNAAAAAYFSDVLWSQPAAQDAREYLAKRGIDRAAAERFGLGFAPREIGLMRAHLDTLGYDDARQLEAGLLVRREESDEPRPRFRNRLIIPIHDLAGQCAGFGGRLIGPGEPKYLNSSESPTFSKGKLLYGMHQARHAIRKAERVILVEGYFDVIRLVLAGVDEVVAPLGTALTTEQAALMARYCKEAFLLYDSDPAGLKATFRAGDELLRHGVAVRVVTLPDGEDPDTYVAERGKAALDASLGAAVDVFERKVNLLERGGWFADLHKRRQAIDRLLPTVRAASDTLTRELYITRASEVSGVSREVLEREVEGGGGGGRGGAERGGGRRVSPRHEAEPSRQVAEQRTRGDRAEARAARAGPRTPKASAEGALVHAMLLVRSLVESVTERTGPDSFRDPVYREMFTQLLEVGPEADVQALAADLSQEAVDELQRMLESPGAIADITRTVEDSLRALRMRELDERSAASHRAMRATVNEEERDRLMREIRDISQERRALDAARAAPTGKSSGGGSSNS
jgi:DNA primase